MWTFVLACLLIMEIFIVIGRAHADAWYVSEKGDNSNSGDSWAQAFRSVGKADTAMTGGDTVYIGAGTWYNTTIYPPSGGTASDWTVYTCSTMAEDEKWQTVLSAGEILGGWSEADEANIYQAYYPKGKSYCLRQNDSLVRPVFDTDGIDGISGAGWFFHDTSVDSVFARLNGDADPDTVTELVISSNHVICIKSTMSGRSFIKFWGLDLRDGGPEALINFDQDCSNIRWEHCSIHYGAGSNGENGGLIFFTAQGPDTSGFYRDMAIRSCSLGHCLNEPTGSGGNPFLFGHCLTPYTSMRFVVDSSYFYRFGHGVFWKTNIATTGSMTNKTVKFCSFWNGRVAIASLCSADRDSVYGCYFWDCEEAYFLTPSSCYPSNCDYEGKHWFCYNTVYNMTDEAYHVWDNNKDFLGVDNVSKHNIFSDVTPVDGVCGIWYLPDSALHFTIDSNIYYDCDDEFNVGGSGGDCDCSNWAGWIDCYDQNSPTLNTENPNFTNETTHDFSRTSWNEHDSVFIGERWWYTEGAWQPRNGGPPGPSEPRPNRNKNSVGGGLVQ